MVGGRTHETPSLKAADVGVTLGTWSTKIARETSDIDVLDRNFSFLVIIMKHGRCAYKNVQKYTQLELTMTIVGLSISFITTSSYGDSDCGNTRGNCSVKRATSEETNALAASRT